MGREFFSSWGHHGFDAYLQVVDKLLKYLGKHEARLQGHIKLWIVGYSRGAAIANLTGAFMANVLAAFERMGEPEGSPVANYVLRPKDLFVYTFATPKTTTKSNHNASKYSSIFNIINQETLFPSFLPRAWVTIDGMGETSIYLNTLPSLRRGSAFIIRTGRGNTSGLPVTRFPQCRWPMKYCLTCSRT